MLSAKKSAWFEKVFAIYCRNLFKRRFHTFRISNSDLLVHVENQLPLVIYCNHSSWWDGLVAFEVSQNLKLDSFVMMEEKQLKNLSLFRQLGAFSVIREKPREAVKSINYAIKLLKEKQDRTLWVFPQGEILPNDIPIKFFNGVSRIIEKIGNCNIVSMAICYEFLGDFKPEIFVKFGNLQKMEISRDFNSKILTKHFEDCLSNTMRDLKMDINTNNFNNYERLF
jgi:chlorobactene lauroyltransferase